MFTILRVRSRSEWTIEMFFLFKENSVYAVLTFKGAQSLFRRKYGRVSRGQMCLHVEIDIDGDFC